MSQLFSHNAYGVLGLDSGASQKDVSRRANEIIKLLKIDEEPSYETDIKSIYNVERTEATVKDAVQRLSSPGKRIIEYFFWFEVETDQDEKNIELLRDNQYDEAVDDWKSRADKSQTAKRNLAIASSLILDHTGYKKYLRLSIDTWKDLLGSDKFWQHFEKVYALNDEIGTSKSVVDDFHNKVPDILSDFYTEVSRAKKDNSIYAAFSSAFNTKGSKVQDEVLAPIFEQIHDASDQLDKLNVSEDKVLSSQESMTIGRLVKKIQGLFQEIKELGLYNDSYTKVMRDKAAEAIRSVSVDIFNNLDEDDKSLVLIKVARSFVSGPATTSQIEKDIKYILRVVSNRKIIDPINELIEKENYQKALKILDEEQTKHKDDKDLQIYFTKRIQWCVTASADKDFTEAKRLYDADQFQEAESWFSSVYDFIYSYIGDFDIDKNSLDTILETLRGKLINLEMRNYDDIDSYRQQVIENCDSSIKDETKFELPVIIMLLDAAIYQRLSQRMPEIKRSMVKNAPPLYTLNGIGTKIYGDTLYFVFLFIPLFPLASYDLDVTTEGKYRFYSKKKMSVGKKVWLIAFILLTIIIAVSAASGSSTSSTGDTGSTSPSSTSSTTPSAWQTCSDEYDTLKSQLDSINSTMDSYKTAGNTDAYNNLVSQQNSLVEQVNSKATECNNLR